MKLNQDQINNLCSLAKVAARKAGEIIRARSDEEIEVQTKDSGSELATAVVTEVDLLCQNAILEVLNPTLTEYDLGLLTEEIKDDGSRLIKDYFWCIDPLDGTLPFIEKVAGYAVSIALVEKSGSSCIGVAFDPRTDTLYHAIKGSGAFINNTPLSITESQSDKFTLYLNRSSVDNTKYTTLLEKIKPTISEELEVKSLGGGVMNTIWSIENNPACYIILPKKEDGGGALWDFAACSLILNEAGGSATDLSDNPLDLNREDSIFLNHRGVLMASSPKLTNIILGII